MGLHIARPLRTLQDEARAFSRQESSLGPNKYPAAAEGPNAIAITGTYTP